MNYWLMKTEPDEFSIDDLKDKETASWDGVRNYQARNFMKEMRKGDQVFIYHSSCEHIGITGLAEIVEEASIDITSLDQRSPYFDPKSTKENPRWVIVKLKWIKTFNKIISLEWIKLNDEISEIALKKGNSRLSVMPVATHEFEIILKFGNEF